MPLSIPTTRQVLPEQNSVQGIDPSRSFGNDVSRPVEAVDVPRGMGGVPVDRSAIADSLHGLSRTMFGASDDISNTLRAVAEDETRKEKALRKANETLVLAESSQQHQAEWLEKQLVTKRMLYAGEIDSEQAKTQAASDLDDLNQKYFDPEKFKDIDVNLKAKLTALELRDAYKTNFKKDVINPYLTNKFTERLNTVTAQAAQTTSDAARTGNQEDGVRAYEANRKNIDNIYSSVEAAMMLGPEEVLKQRAKQLQANGRALIDGLLARDYVPGKGGSYNPIKGAEIKLASISLAQEALMSNAQLRTDIGADADNILKRMEDMKAHQLEFIQRQQDSQERRAERAQDRAEKARFAVMLEDLNQNGLDSRYINEQTIIRSGLDPMSISRLLDKKRNIEEGEKTADQAYRVVEDMIANNLSMAKPDKVNAHYLDQHFMVMKRDPSFRNASPDEQANQVALTYGKVGWLPETLKNDIAKGLRSQDPRVLQGSMLIVRKLEQQSPTIIDAFSPEDRAFYQNHKDGMDLQTAAKLRDSQLFKTPETAKLEHQTYLNSLNAKKDYEAQAANDKQFKKLADDKFGHYFSSNPEIPQSLYSTFNDKVKQYAPLVNFDMKKAQELAFQDTTKHVGESAINGTKRLMMNAPEAVYRGVSSEKLSGQFSKAVDELKKALPQYKDKKIEDFNLISDATYNTANPTWQITLKDSSGYYVPILDPTTYKPFAYFSYDASQDLKEAQEKQQAAIEKAQAERLANIEREKRSRTRYAQPVGPQNAR